MQMKRVGVKGRGGRGEDVKRTRQVHMLGGLDMKEDRQVVQVGQPWARNGQTQDVQSQESSGSKIHVHT